MGKNNPLNEDDLDDFIKLQRNFQLSELSWIVDFATINQNTWDLSVKNPNSNDEIIHRSPEEIISELEELDSTNREILQRIKSLL
jgi:type I restriction enzyme M protein